RRPGHRGGRRLPDLRRGEPCRRGDMPALRRPDGPARAGARAGPGAGHGTAADPRAGSRAGESLVVVAGRRRDADRADRPGGRARRDEVARTDAEVGRRCGQWRLTGLVQAEGFSRTGLTLAARRLTCSRIRLPESRWVRAAVSRSVVPEATAPARDLQE